MWIILIHFGYLICQNYTFIYKLTMKCKQYQWYCQKWLFQWSLSSKLSIFSSPAIAYNNYLDIDYIVVILSWFEIWSNYTSYLWTSFNISKLILLDIHKSVRHLGRKNLCCHSTDKNCGNLSLTRQQSISFSNV